MDEFASRLDGSTDHSHSESNGEVEGVEGRLVDDDEVVPGQKRASEKSGQCAFQRPYAFETVQ